MASRLTCIPLIQSLNGLRDLIQPRKRNQKMSEDMETKLEKERGKDKPTHLLLLAIQLNGEESLQQDTKMQIHNKVKTIIQKLTVEKEH